MSGCEFRYCMYLRIEQIYNTGLDCMLWSRFVDFFRLFLSFKEFESDRLWVSPQRKQLLNYACDCCDRDMAFKLQTISFFFVCFSEKTACWVLHVVYSMAQWDFFSHLAPRLWNLCSRTITPPPSDEPHYPWSLSGLLISIGFECYLTDILAVEHLWKLKNWQNCTLMRLVLLTFTLCRRY